jgi:Secretion system C-terminal sorting domain
MKKYTLLFATMLAMSGMAFGQKEGKTIWGKEVLPNGNFKGIEVSQSPDKSLLLNGNDYSFPRRFLIQSFNKDGQNQLNISKQFSDSSSFFFDSRFKNDVISTPVFNRKTLSTMMDSAVFLNENQRKLIKLAVIGYTVENDGSIIVIDNTNTIKKINSDSKIVWQYTPPQKNKIKGGYGNIVWTYEFGGNRPYVDRAEGETITKLSDGYLFKYETDDINNSGYLILDKNGKERAIKKSFTEPVYATKDGGIIVKHDGFQKLNSQGEELWSFRDDSKYVAPNGNTVNRNELFGILPDEGLILQNFYTLCDNGKCTSYKSLIKVSKEGKLLWQTDWIKNFKDQELMSMNDGGFMTFSRDEKVNGEVINSVSGVRWSSIHRFDKNGNLLWRFPDEESNKIVVKKIEILPDNSFLVQYRIITGFSGDLASSMYHVAKISNSGKIDWTFSVTNALKPLNNLSYGYAIAGDKREQGGDYLYLNILDKQGNITSSLKWQQTSKITSISSINEDEEGNLLVSGLNSSQKSGESVVFIMTFFKISKDGKILNQLNFPDKIKRYYFLNEIFPSGDGNYFLVYHQRSIDDNTNSFLPKLYIKKFGICGNSESPTITANKTEACPTEAVKLSIQKQDGVSYQWQKDGVDIVNVQDGVHDFNESGTYTVKAKDEICQSEGVSNAVKVTIRSLPSTSIKTDKTSPCEGERNVMSVATTNGSFFQWQKDEKDIPNATLISYDNSGSGRYRVGVRDDKCPQTGYSNVLTINAKPLPESSISTDIKGVIYEPFTVKMTANTGTGLSYQWLKDDVIIPSETTANYEAKKSGKYNVSVSKDGCIKLSDALTISILIPLANQEEVGGEVVQIYPNPNKGEFKIILPKSLKSADIQLFDSYGRERILTHTGEQAQAEGLVIGAYFLRVSKEGKTVTSKLIIE